MEHVIDHLSISQVKTFQRCPMQWYFSYVEGLKIPPATALINGSAVHAGNETIYNSKKAEGKYNRSEVLDVTRDYVVNADSKEEVNWDKPKEEIIDLSTKLVGCYMDSDTPDRVQQEEIEGVEHGVEVFLEDGELSVKVVGYIDLLLNNKVIDYKTIEKTPKIAEPADKLQTAFYASAEDKKATEVHYAVKLKTPKIVILPGASHDLLEFQKKQSHRIILSTYKAIMASIKSGDFMPSGVTHPWACNKCAYGEKGICPYYAFKKSA